MITIRGAIFGRLIINSVCLSFKSETRKRGKKYMFGSTPYNQTSEHINKKWPLDSIKEVVLKRYNLVRQAVEIYFHNSGSVFFCLFHRQYLMRFLTCFSSILRKNKQLSIEVVTSPEAYFAEKKFKERWLAGAISNFEYLILLNKYSGRSFNDLSQYPVFPWIIKDYASPSISISSPSIYRPLDTTIAAITPEKRKCADEKLKVLLEEDVPSAYQFGSHYLPGRVVLGYLLRLEPYASLLVSFERGHDAAARMFHFLKQTWVSCETDIGDNRELIPEFYYLPDFFVNHNFYQYGSKEADYDLPRLALKGKRVMVDQTVLPPWARNNHAFVQINARALESRIVSLHLDRWIDLIFGCKQQDRYSYNMFRALCDESAVTKKSEKLNQSQITEVQEFGINPMQLFKEKHPAKSDKVINSRTQYALFTESAPGEERLFALIRLHQFKDCAVIFIESYEKRAVAVLSSQKVCRSKEGYINVAHERSVVFEKKEAGLFPHKRIYDSGAKACNCDVQRCFVTLDNGNTILSCKHYDNTCKLVNCGTGEVECSLVFHKVVASTGNNNNRRW